MEVDFWVGLGLDMRGRVHMRKKAPASRLRENGFGGRAEGGRYRPDWSWAMPALEMRTSSSDLPPLKAAMR